MKSKLTLTSTLLAILLSPDSYAKNIIKDIFQYDNNSKRSIELNELSQGCSRIDCIPAIDKPEFGDITDAYFLHDDDVMMFLEYNHIRKAYPRKIMQTHEIVNDYYGDIPIAMTYCPLCGTSVAFVAKVDGVRVEFGVSGVLHNSDLVMYDRTSRTLWGQITGRAIVGPKTGERLKSIGVGLLKWKELKVEFPDTQVLMPPTKKKSRYSKFRYQKYAKSEKLKFPVAFQDSRLAAKQIVYGIDIDNRTIAFEESYLKKRTPFVQTFGNRTLQVTYAKGKATALDKKTGETFNVLRAYWFAWYTFHPETELRN